MRLKTKNIMRVIKLKVVELLISLNNSFVKLLKSIYTLISI